jgi:anthranilate phosphoribosyltransferase
MDYSDIQSAIHLLLDGQDLTSEQAQAAMDEIMSGEATEAQIGAFLAALRLKGETVDEITGCASAMRRNAVQVEPDLGDEVLMDIVGTGGDGTKKFNISTIAAFVIAGAGVKVAKHGNRSNHRAGSADVLEALGAELPLTPEQAAESLHDVGIAFLFAPAYHPAMRYAVGPRRELATRTVFNVLGPLTNPAPTTHQVVGVFSPDLLEFMAGVLHNMGSKGAYVVHGKYETGAGLDELTTTGPSRIAHLHGGEITTFDLEPADYGFERATLADLQGGDAATNAGIARSLLSGEMKGPRRDVVLLNAGAALGLLDGDMESGISAARESLDSGAAMDRLDRYVAQTQAYASAR